MRFLALILLLAAPAARAQRCPGDCNGDGVVRIDEVVSGVRIALGDAELAQCPDFDTSGDGSVSIDELVRVVGFALNGCPATPVPTDTASPTETAPPVDTPTATPTDTPAETATATPTVPVVSGSWTEAPLSVDETTCAAVLSDSLAEQFAERGPCVQTVSTPNESTAHGTDCSGQSIDGTLDRDGTIHLQFPTTADTIEGCTVTLDISSAVNLASSPTAAHYLFGLSFSGACEGLPSCLVRASGTWTRSE